LGDIDGVEVFKFPHSADEHRLHLFPFIDESCNMIWRVQAGWNSRALCRARWPKMQLADSSLEYSMRLTPSWPITSLPASTRFKFCNSTVSINIPKQGIEYTGSCPGFRLTYRRPTHGQNAITSVKPILIFLLACLEAVRIRFEFQRAAPK
jgi:hypothetical protein